MKYPECRSAPAVGIPDAVAPATRMGALLFRNLINLPGSTEVRGPRLRHTSRAHALRKYVRQAMDDYHQKE